MSGLDGWEVDDGVMVPGPWTQAIAEVVARVEDTNAIVLIRGEPGTGKDTLARLIHAASSRAPHLFVKIDCAALPPDRLATELFGHERGAFEGATRRRLGKLEFAHRGTLFLAEIGRLPRALQPKLLATLRNHTFSRIGGHEAISVDVRLLATTTETLRVSAGADRFWDDSLPLRVVDLQLPPLRARKEDLPALAAHLLASMNEQYRRDVELSSDTLALFTEYAWPGNVRELERVVRRLAVGEDPAQIHAEIQARLGLFRDLARAQSA